MDKDKNYIKDIMNISKDLEKYKICQEKECKLDEQKKIIKDVLLFYIEYQKFQSKTISKEEFVKHIIIFKNKLKKSKDFRKIIECHLNKCNDEFINVFTFLLNLMKHKNKNITKDEIDKIDKILKNKIKYNSVINGIELIILLFIK